MRLHPSEPRPPSRKPDRPFRKQHAWRPTLERLETRLVPSADVLSYHNDQMISGQQPNETVLTPQNVNSSNFGKLFSYPLDGYVYAQPLYKANLTMADGTVHDVIFAATEHDSVYALDAVNHDPATGGGVLWHASFLNSAAGITTVPAPQDVNTSDIVPEIGITGTPVIDASTNTLYVVAKTKETGAGGSAHYVQKLHALDIVTGADKGSVLIGDTTSANGKYTNNTDVVVAGTGDGSANGMVAFNALRENQRPGLTLANGTIYVAFASHGDNGPYHGWLLGYSAQTLQKVSQFNTTPNGGKGGIWQGGGAPAVDQLGNLYFATGNGTFDFRSVPPVGDFGNSVLKVAPDGQTVMDFFSPSNNQSLNSGDLDLGSGTTMIFDEPATAGHGIWHLAVQAGKTGQVFLLDRDNMGKISSSGPDKVLQTLSLGGPGVWGAPSFWNNTIYYGSSDESIKGLEVYFNATPVAGYPNGRIQIRLRPHATPTVFGYPGTEPVISSDGLTNGIVWAVQSQAYTNQGSEVLYAYDASDLGHELYNSNAAEQRDVMGGAVKFVAPTVADGRVYVGARRELDVFGLFGLAGQASSSPIFVVHPDGSLSEQMDSMTSIPLVSSGVEAVSTGPGGGIFVIGTDQTLWQKTVTGWNQLAGGGMVLAISAGADSSGKAVVDAVGTDNSLWMHNEAGWHQLMGPGQVSAVSAGPDETVFAIATDQSLWVFKEGWQQLASAGLVQAISAGSDLSGQPLVDVVGLDHSLWQYNVSGWQQLASAGLAKDVSAGPRDTVFATGLDNSLWEEDLSGWMELDPIGTPDGPALVLNGTSDKAGQPAVFAIAQDHSLWEHTNTGWIEWAPPGTVQSMSAVI